MLNICIVFAHFGTRNFQKRVADAYYSRSQKSFYMGRQSSVWIPADPTPLWCQDVMYEINTEAASRLRLIYELYSQAGMLLRRHHPLLSRATAFSKTESHGDARALQTFCEIPSTFVRIYPSMSSIGTKALS